MAPQTHYLVHACLEGPEAGVYYRGEAVVSKGATQVTVTLPAYVAQLAKEFTVLLTNHQHFILGSVTDVVTDFVIEIEKPAVRDLCFHWQVLGKRKAIQVEVPQSKVTKRGHGPYTWLEDL